MSKAPSMPMFWDAYLADTTHLSTEEHGAYLLLLGAMWRRNGWVPDDDRDNARILGLTPAKWRRTKDRLSAFLTFQDGQITQKNLLKIWEITQEKIETNRSNGAKGGRPKSSVHNGLAKANGSYLGNRNETIPEPEPDKKRETNVSLPQKPVRRKSRIPEDAAISDAQIRAAQKRGHSMQEAEAQFQKFKNDALAKGKTFLDWDRAFVTWLDSEFFRPLVDGVRNGNGTNLFNGTAARRENRTDPAIEQIARLAGIGKAPGNGCH